MKNYRDLAALIFPDVTSTIEDLEKRYPLRNVEGEVTRFAPSPTGFLHTGSLFTSLVSRLVASSSNGIFYLRLEDTDTKREVPGAKETLVEGLKTFLVTPDEGFDFPKEKGNYGPYLQSQRKDIYRIVLKELVARGDVYPCFCTSDDLNKLREFQERNKMVPGYYGEFAKCRNLSVDEAYERISKGENYVLRFKSHGDHENKIDCEDLIRGHINIAENDLDVVVLKSDGLPTYHFAHVCDDHFMRTSIVIRGEEWISSLPLHIEMFKRLNFPLVKYAHLPLIMKMDEGKKRKFSKRKDPEANVSYFLENGYPPVSLIVYLMTIVNSNFEEWLVGKNVLDYPKFKFSFDKMSLDGALFDLKKLDYYSKEVIASFDLETLFNNVKEYAKVYEPSLYELILRDENYFKRILNIERDGDHPRKDYAKYKDIYPSIKFFYRDLYEDIISSSGIAFNPKFEKDLIETILEESLSLLDSENEQVWFAGLKEIAQKHHFASDNKTYKANPNDYVGQVGDVAEMLRIAIAGSRRSPNLFTSMQILGVEEIRYRIKFIENNLLK